MNAIVNSNQKTPVPPIYDTSDLDELKTFCWEPHVSDYNLAELVKTQEGIDHIFSTCNYESLLASLNRLPGADMAKTAIAWKTSHLRRMAVDGEGAEGVSVLFFIIGDEPLSGTDKAFIQQITDTYKIRVIVKRASFSIVATEGQYRYFSDVSHKNNAGWHFMLLADNHDLYRQHFEDSTYLPNCHLLIPNGVPRLGEKMTVRAGEQAQIDARRHKEMMWAFVAYRNNCKVLGRDLEPLPVHNPMPASSSV